MKISPIKQRDPNACGPTCIEMVLAYFGISHSVSDITRITKYKKAGGMYNRDVIRTLQHYGLKTKTFKNTTWESLSELNTSDSVIIISWMLEGYIGHLSVVEKIDKKHIYLAEPSTGDVLKIERIKFLRLWLDYEAKPEVPMYPESKSNIQLRWMCVAKKS